MKLELDSRLKCLPCGTTPYYLYRRPVQEGSEVYENVIWPAPGSGTPPPERSGKTICPNCGGELKRE